MSYTEMFKILLNGDVVSYREFGNSHRGASLIWKNLGERYLGDPLYIYHCDNYGFGTLYPNHNSKNFWDLAGQIAIPVEERIVLASTFDIVVVRKKNFQRLIDAFKHYARSYEDTGHALAYVEALEELMDDNDCLGICWNQTSVSCDVWPEIWDYDEDGAEIDGTDRPFNINTDEHTWFSKSDHWFLFDKYYIDNPPLNDLVIDHIGDTEEDIINRLGVNADGGD